MANFSHLKKKKEMEDKIELLLSGYPNLDSTDIELIKKDFLELINQTQNFKLPTSLEAGDYYEKLLANFKKDETAINFGRGFWACFGWLRSIEEKQNTK